MPSPFPGMDPYLEQEVIWHDFHERFLPAAAAQISAQVLPRYIVLIDESVYLQDVEMEAGRPGGRPDLTVAGWPASAGSSGVATGILEAPAQVRVPEVEQERESFLKICDRMNRQVITVIELLSPTNKRRGENRLRYLAKRADFLNSPAHLVEIDLLRGGPPMPAEDRPECVYSVLVSRTANAPRRLLADRPARPAADRSLSRSATVSPTPASTSAPSSTVSTTRPDIAISFTTKSPSPR